MVSAPTLTADECVLLLRELRESGAARLAWDRRLRNWTMGMVMLEAGLRVGELVGLNVADLVFIHESTGNGEPVRALVVRAEIAKRHRERLVPVSVRLHGAIAEMWREVWARVGAWPGMPCWYVGRGLRRMTSRQVESIVRGAALRCLGRPVHPHVLRHTFGTRIERVAGIRVAQELLGHQDIRTTERYTHPAADELLRAVNGEGRLPSWSG